MTTEQAGGGRSMSEVASENAHPHYTDAERRRIYEAILSNTPDFIYVIGTDHKFTYANESLLRMWGRTAETALGKTFIELGYEPWHAEMHVREIDEVIATGKPYRGEVPFTGTHGKRIYDYIFSPIFGDDGRVTAIAGTTRDVTDRKKIEEDLRISEERRELVLKSEREARAYFGRVLDSAQDYAIISTDIKGSIVSWSKGAERMFHYTREEAIGKAIDMIFVPEDRDYGVAAYELSHAAEKGNAHDERWHLRRDGSRFYAAGIMTAMRDGDGRVQGFVKIARDMTHEKQLKEELIAARNDAEAANIVKTEFLTNMSHEIRTPMNAIIGLSNILAHSQPLNAKQRHYIRTLQMSADALLALLNDLLDIGKIETHSVELEQIPFSVVRVVQETISMLSEQTHAKGLELTFNQRCACVDKRVFVGDPTRLRQIVLNLFSNAVKFTDKGSVVIEVSCAATEDPAIEQIVITVEDTGIGIAADKLESVFQKFVQGDSSINRRYGGTGLGLAITKTLAKVMGGAIGVESSLGVGSKFTFTLPLRIAAAGDVVHYEGTLAHLSLTNVKVEIKPRILLVEDYGPNVLVASAFLEAFGYEYEVAENGAAAVEKAKAGGFAAVLMDVQMPGTNGLEATHMIRALEKQQARARLPIIGMTAHALKGDRERCIDAGMDDYISKPFNPVELRQKIETLVEGSSKIAF